MSSFPLIKLISLTVKTVSKPISKIIKSKAKDNQYFKKACIGTGNIKYRIVYYFNRIVNHRPGELRSIDENYAINMGSEIIGEFIVYGTGAGIITWEFFRNNEKKKKQEEIQNIRLQSIEQRLDRLESVSV